MVGGGGDIVMCAEVDGPIVALRLKVGRTSGSTLDEAPLTPLTLLAILVVDELVLRRC